MAQILTSVSQIFWKLLKLKKCKLRWCLNGSGSFLKSLIYCVCQHASRTRPKRPVPCSCISMRDSVTAGCSGHGRNVWPCRITWEKCAYQVDANLVRKTTKLPTSGVAASYLGLSGESAGHETYDTEPDGTGTSVGWNLAVQTGWGCFCLFFDALCWVLERMICSNDINMYWIWTRKQEVLRQNLMDVYQTWGLFKADLCPETERWKSLVRLKRGLLPAICGWSLNIHSNLGFYGCISTSIHAQTFLKTNSTKVHSQKKRCRN